MIELTAALRSVSSLFSAPSAKSGAQGGDFASSLTAVLDAAPAGTEGSDAGVVLQPLAVGGSGLPTLAAPVGEVTDAPVFKLTGGDAAPLPDPASLLMATPHGAGELTLPGSHASMMAHVRVATLTATDRGVTDMPALDEGELAAADAGAGAVRPAVTLTPAAVLTTTAPELPLPADHSGKPQLPNALLVAPHMSEPPAPSVAAHPAGAFMPPATTSVTLAVRPAATPITAPVVHDMSSDAAVSAQLATQQPVSSEVEELTSAQPAVLSATTQAIANDHPAARAVPEPDHSPAARLPAAKGAPPTVVVANASAEPASKLSVVGDERGPAAPAAPVIAVAAPVSVLAQPFAAVTAPVLAELLPMQVDLAFAAREHVGAKEPAQVVAGTARPLIKNHSPAVEVSRSTGAKDEPVAAQPTRDDASVTPDAAAAPAVPLGLVTTPLPTVDAPRPTGPAATPARRTAAVLAAAGTSLQVARAIEPAMSIGRAPAVTAMSTATTGLSAVDAAPPGVASAPASPARLAEPPATMAPGTVPAAVTIQAPIPAPDAGSPFGAAEAAAAPVETTVPGAPPAGLPLQPATPRAETAASPISPQPTLPAATPQTAAAPAVQAQRPPAERAPAAPAAAPVMVPAVAPAAAAPTAPRYAMAQPAAQPAARSDAAAPGNAAAQVALASQRQAVAPAPGLTAPAAQVFAAAMRAAVRDERADDRAITPSLAAPLTISGLAGVQQVLAAATGGSGNGAPLDMRQESWPQAMIAHIERLRDAADAADTSIRVVPDALGSIDVSVRRSGDTVHVQFAAEQAATRQLLHDAQPKLAEFAEARGMRLGSTNIDPGNAGAGSGTGADGARQFAARRNAAPAPAKAASADDVPAADTDRIA